MPLEHNDKWLKTYTVKTAISEDKRMPTDCYILQPLPFE
jgi:hypothetical protein